ncbi:MAG: metallophosphoesterase [Pseudomonadota bacterium]
MNRRHFLAGLLTSGVALTGCTVPARPTGDKQKPLRIAFFTDSHARVEWGTPVAMQRAAAAINAQNPDIIIGGGDYITDGFEFSAQTVAPRWEVFLDFYNALQFPTYLTIGNHDLVGAIPVDGSEPEADPKAIYREKFGLESTYYSFDFAGYHFMMLDSVQVIGGEYLYRGFIDEQQQQWIRDDLAAVSADTPIIVGQHIPLLTTFYQSRKGATFAAKPNRVTVNNREVLELFERHNLRLVLQGHLHTKERIDWRDTTFIMGGAICGRWWRGPWRGTPEGFAMITISADRIDWEYITYGWKSRRPKNE